MNNRNIKIISGLLVAACVLVIVTAVFVLKKYMNPPVHNGEKAGNEIKTEIAEVTASPAPTPEKETDTVMQTITSDTRFVLQTHYIDAVNHDKIEEENGSVPSTLIAMNRGDLEKYLSDYMEDMPLDEYLNGLLSYEIIDFSGEQVILRKTYASDWNGNEFYLCDKDGEIVVYYSDKDTVYEYTGIKTELLSKEEQIRLKIGYYVTDEEELYALLESYSS